MTVFLLDISISPYERRYDKAIVGPRDFSDVFLSIDEAVDAGQKQMAGWLEEIKEIFSGTNIGFTYEFKVYEFDPDVKRAKSGKWEKFAEWDYDCEGELLDRCETTSLSDGWYVGYSKRPGDEDDNAGSRFKPGEFVRLKARHNNETIFAIEHKQDEDGREISLGDVISSGARSDDETIYVVRQTPGKGDSDDDTHENVYTLYFINKNMKFDHCHPHEADILSYDGEVPKGHPMHLIKRYILGEVEFNDELWADIFYGRVIFDHPNEMRSWKDVFDAENT